jgi:hypothetical protein
VSSTPTRPENRWLAETLRVTIFPTPGAAPNEQNPWARLVGEEPETRSMQPRAGLIQEEGLVDGRKLHVGSSASRIDIVLGAPTPDDVPDSPLTLSFAEGLGQLLAVVRRWIAIGSDARRLAFGAVLLQPVASREQGYESLAEYLPAIQLDPLRSSDFFYQINRPRPSAVYPGMTINRLSRWAVANFKFTRLSIGAGAESAMPITQSFATRLELDVNTPTDQAEDLTSDRLEPLFAELIAYGQEIAADGDRP